MKKQVVAVCGPTAVGKTEYAIDAAEHFQGEIVSCDSMQLYKFMDIGSAKPTPEEIARAKHYLVDEIDPREPFSAARFQHMAKDAIRTIQAKGKLPIIAGGTGLYFHSLVYDMDFSTPPADPARRKELEELGEKEGREAVYRILQELDPEKASRIDGQNTRKVIRAIEAAESGGRIGDISKDPKPTEDYHIIMIGLSRDREELYDRINRRVDILMDMGLLDEVKSLLDMGLTEEHISMKGIGYKEIIGYLHGEYDLDEAVRLTKRNTRHLAKRQMTWFRRYPEMKWFSISDYNNEADCKNQMLEYISQELEK